MAALRLIYALLLFATAAYAVEIRFVPPSAEGTVSLGIYDNAGKLVRVLCDEWPIANFSAGLNGLSTEWDGKDSGGQTVAAGTYTARGFHMGEVAVDGEAFHFNGWITTEDAPRVVSVGAVGILAGGDLLLAARLAKEAGPDTESAIRLGLKLTLQRDSQNAEVLALKKAHAAFVQEAGLSEEDALRRVALLLLNLNEFIYIE